MPISLISPFLPVINGAGSLFKSAARALLPVHDAGCAPLDAFSSSKQCARPSFRLVAVAKNGDSSQDQLRAMPFVSEYKDESLVAGATEGSSVLKWAIVGGSVLIIGGVTYALIKFLVTNSPITRDMKKALMRAQAYGAATVAVVAAPSLASKLGLLSVRPIVNAFYGSSWPFWVMPMIAAGAMWLGAVFIPKEERYRPYKLACWGGASVLTSLLMTPITALPRQMLALAGVMTLGIVVPVHMSALAAQTTLGFWLVSPLAVMTAATTMALVSPSILLVAPILAGAMAYGWVVIAADTSTMLESIRETGDDADDLANGVAIFWSAAHVFFKILYYMIKIARALTSKRDED